MRGCCGTELVAVVLAVLVLQLVQAVLVLHLVQAAALAVEIQVGLCSAEVDPRFVQALYQYPRQARESLLAPLALQLLVLLQAESVAAQSALTVHLVD